MTAEPEPIRKTKMTPEPEQAWKQMITEEIMAEKEIILAKSAGFCFGVQRAVNKVYEEAEKSGDIYTYGPIIHNREVVADLEKKGVRVVE